MKRNDLLDLKARSLDVMEAHWRQGKVCEVAQEVGIHLPQP